MDNITVTKKRSELQRVVLATLRTLVVVAAVMLILIITRDIFDNVSFLVDPRYLTFQFWICVIFMVDIVIEFFLGARTWRRLLLEIVFFFLCIPFINIIDYYGIHVSGEVMFILRVLPMLRATYIIVQVTSTVNRDKVANLFKAYITLFIVVVYFSSLMFYVEEHSVNNDVESYWSALWWTVMTLTTAGCYITEVTTVGKILSVVLSGGGLILFPIFTVYVANAVSGSGAAQPSNDSDNDKNQDEKTDQAGNNANFADDKTQTSAAQPEK